MVPLREKEKGDEEEALLHLTPPNPKVVGWAEEEEEALGVIASLSSHTFPTQEKRGAGERGIIFDDPTKRKREGTPQYFTLKTADWKKANASAPVRYFSLSFPAIIEL